MKSEETSENKAKNTKCLKVFSQRDKEDYTSMNTNRNNPPIRQEIKTERKDWESTAGK